MQLMNIYLILAKYQHICLVGLSRSNKCMLYSFLLTIIKYKGTFSALMAKSARLSGSDNDEYINNKEFKS